MGDLGQVVDLNDFPGGLRCGECDRVMVDGDFYATKLEGMVDDIPVTLVVCLDCAMGWEVDVD